MTRVDIIHNHFYLVIGLVPVLVGLLLVGLHYSNSRMPFNLRPVDGSESSRAEVLRAAVPRFLLAVPRFPLAVPRFCTFLRTSAPARVSKTASTKTCGAGWVTRACRTRASSRKLTRAKNYRPADQKRPTSVDQALNTLWLFEFEWRFSALSASKVIFRARMIICSSGSRGGGVQGVRAPLL